MIIDQSVFDSLKKRYCDVHPILFNRCLEKSSTVGEIFEQLETIKDLMAEGDYPIVWDDAARRWTVCDAFSSHSWKDV